LRLSWCSGHRSIQLMRNFRRGPMPYLRPFA
jgi:hypothetical protein